MKVKECLLVCIGLLQGHYCISIQKNKTHIYAELYCPQTNHPTLVIKSNKQLFNSELELLNLSLELTAFVRSDAASNDRARDTTRAAKACL